MIDASFKKVLTKMMNFCHFVQASKTVNDKVKKSNNNDNASYETNISSKFCRKEQRDFSFQKKTIVQWRMTMILLIEIVNDWKRVVKLVMMMSVVMKSRMFY